MNTTRLEMFSDGVIAILITIMVLELKVPHGAEWSSLQPLLPIFLAYILSFLYLAIYWNNHHHMLHATEHVDGRILWANLHLLFWLSLIPFVTGWMSENHFAPVPVALYGVVLLMAAVAYKILQTAITAHEDANHALKEVLGRDLKGRFSVLAYALAIPLTFVSEWIAIGIFIALALLWIVPDLRIERTLGHR
jgi:uncharacterized membrane protein